MGEQRPKIPRWRFSIAVVCCRTLAVFGEEGLDAANNRSPILSPSASNPPSARATHASGVSPWVRSALNAKLPSFKPTAQESDSASDAIKLPPVLVIAPKLRVPDEAQAASRREFAARLRKEYPGASVPGQDPFRIEHGAPNYARLQYEDDRRAQQVKTLNGFADLVEKTGDRATAERLRKELQFSPASTYKDPLLDAMDKSANGGRR